jgi:hypothetical protein
LKTSGMREKSGELAQNKAIVRMGEDLHVWGVGTRGRIKRRRESGNILGHLKLNVEVYRNDYSTELLAGQGPAAKFRVSAKNLCRPYGALRKLGSVTQGLRPGLSCAAPTGLVQAGQRLRSRC